MAFDAAGEQISNDLPGRLSFQAASSIEGHEDRLEKPLSIMDVIARLGLPPHLVDGSNSNYAAAKMLCDGQPAGPAE